MKLHGNFRLHSHSTTKLYKCENLFLEDTDKDILINKLAILTFLWFRIFNIYISAFVTSKRLVYTRNIASLYAFCNCFKLLDNGPRRPEQVTDKSQTIGGSKYDAFVAFNFCDFTIYFGFFLFNSNNWSSSLTVLLTYHLSTQSRQNYATYIVG